MTISDISWNSVKGLEGILQNKGLLVLDTSVVVGISLEEAGVAKRDKKQPWKNRTSKAGQQKLMEIIGTGRLNTGYVVIIPDFIYTQTAGVLNVASGSQGSDLHEWRRMVKKGNVDCYVVRTPFDKARCDLDIFEELEKTLPKNYLDTAKSIPIICDGNWKGNITDRSLIYTAMYLRENFRNVPITVVSDDRTNITTAAIYSKLNRYKIKVCKASEFCKEIR
jgi:hypothetical protein